MRQVRETGEQGSYQSVKTTIMTNTILRRSLVLTDEAARHPFLATLPPHVRGDAQPATVRSAWRMTRDDVRGFASAYFACLAAALVFLA